MPNEADFPSLTGRQAIFDFLAVLVDDLGSATGEGGAADADAFERSVWTPFPLA